MSEENEVSRRAFLETATWTIGGILGAGLAIPAVAYVVGPAIKSDSTKNWVQLGAIPKIEIGTPTLYKINVERKSGWIVSEEELSLYAYTENGRDFLVMSNVCTHLGCRVRWVADQGEFFCPCHNGVFDKEGNVVSGPPPRPLDRFEVKVEGDQLYVLVG
jgi:menaquinol-cytochrome c reductase iron-sulfur subunit